MSDDNPQAPAPLAVERPVHEVSPSAPPADPPADEMSADDFAIEERLPVWQRMLLARAPEATPHNREGWRAALKALLAERI